jgi:hypothetical protein
MVVAAAAPLWASLGPNTTPPPPPPPPPDKQLVLELQHPTNDLSPKNKPFTSRLIF